MDKLQRALSYIRQCPGAIAGQQGHNQTYAIAAKVISGFDLDEEDGMTVMRAYNELCQPPWSEKDLRHKVKDAQQAPGDRGNMLREGNGKPPSVSYVFQDRYPPKAGPAAIIKRDKITPDPDVKLPEPMENPTIRFLEAVFEKGEFLGVAREVKSDDGSTRPDKDDATFDREWWLGKLKKNKGDINKMLASSKKTGAYIRINPMKENGKADKHVTSYRHVLLEFDTISLNEQYSLYLKSDLPITAVIYSGGKSVHAWVKVDAKDRKEYNHRVEILYKFFSDHGLDPQNKNPSRYSRLPGMIRGDKKQDLLALNLGAMRFPEWLESMGLHTFPSIVDAYSLVTNPPPLPAEIITGLLHQGSKMVVGGTSKAHKSWFLLDLAFSVSHGESCLSLGTQKGKVLYLNLEIQTPFIARRLHEVARAKHTEFRPGVIDLWNLRGFCAGYNEIFPRIREKILTNAYTLIILDPIYKVQGELVENAAEDVSRLMNEIERLAVVTGAAVVFSAHFSKGNQAAKESIDRISGSGVYARDPDTIMVMTAHEEEYAFTVDLTLRNFKPMEPFVVRWGYPLLRRDRELNPSKLKQAKTGRPKAYGAEDLLSILGDRKLTAKEWQKDAGDRIGISRAVFYALIKEMKTNSLVVVNDENVWSKSTPSEDSNAPY